MTTAIRNPYGTRRIDIYVQTPTMQDAKHSTRRQGNASPMWETLSGIRISYLYAKCQSISTLVSHHIGLGDISHRHNATSDALQLQHAAVPAFSSSSFIFHLCNAALGNFNDLFDFALPHHTSYSSPVTTIRTLSDRMDIMSKYQPHGRGGGSRPRRAENAESIFYIHALTPAAARRPSEQQLLRTSLQVSSTATPTLSICLLPRVVFYRPPSSLPIVAFLPSEYQIRNLRRPTKHLSDVFQTPATTCSSFSHVSPRRQNPTGIERDKTHARGNRECSRRPHSSDHQLRPAADRSPRQEITTPGNSESVTTCFCRSVQISCIIGSCQYLNSCYVFSQPLLKDNILKRKGLCASLNCVFDISIMLY